MYIEKTFETLPESIHPLKVLEKYPFLFSQTCICLFQRCAPRLIWCLWAGRHWRWPRVQVLTMWAAQTLCSVRMSTCSSWTPVQQVSFTVQSLTPSVCWSGVCDSVCVYPVECKTGDVATLLLMNPAGKNPLLYPDLLHETAKVFGLRGRRLMLFMNEELTEGEEHVSSLSLYSACMDMRNLPHVHFPEPLWNTILTFSTSAGLFVDATAKTHSFKKLNININPSETDHVIHDIFLNKMWLRRWAWFIHQYCWCQPERKVVSRLE